MPFRVPVSYESLPLYGTDPTLNSLATYIDWLRRELVTAEAAFDALNDEEVQPIRPKPSPPAKKPSKETT